MSMKRYLALLICLTLLLSSVSSALSEPTGDDLPDLFVEKPAEYSSLDDPELLQYIEDSVYSQLDESFVGSDYVIENVSAVYVSKEYLEEVAYNTKANVFFGYTLAEINEAFVGKKYVFTCSDSGETVVQEFQDFPDYTNEIILKNIAVGTGVILVCVTVTVISGGIAGPAAAAATASTATKVSLIFAASAKTATACALSGATIGTVSTAVVKGFETNDLYETVKSAEVAGSEWFKWGAISGAAVGGAKEALRIRSVTHGKIPTPQEAEEQAKQLLGGRTQCSYIDGKEVPYGTPGSTRPDVVRTVGNHLEAIEVKRYDLQNSLNELRTVLIDEISARNANLPTGTTQRIVLNVEGRGYTKAYVDSIIKWIQKSLEPIYPSIPVDVMGGVSLKPTHDKKT